MTDGNQPETSFIKKAWLIISIAILAGIIGLIFIFWQKSLPEAFNSTANTELTPTASSPVSNTEPITSNSNTAPATTSSPAPSASTTPPTNPTSTNTGTSSIPRDDFPLDTVSDQTTPQPSTTIFQEITSTFPGRR